MLPGAKVVPAKICQLCASVARCQAWLVCGNPCPGTPCPGTALQSSATEIGFLLIPDDFKGHTACAVTPRYIIAASRRRFWATGASSRKGHVCLCLSQCKPSGPCQTVPRMVASDQRVLQGHSRSGGRASPWRWGETSVVSPDGQRCPRPAGFPVGRVPVRIGGA